MRKSERKLLVGVIIVLCGFLGAHSVQKKSTYAEAPGRVVREPRPTHREPDSVVPIRVVSEMPAVRDDAFIVRPGNLVADEHGNVYVGDSVQHCILVFDRNLRLMKRIGRGGEGPGELSLFKGFMYHLYYKSKTLYVVDIDKKCIHLYSVETGKSILDIKFSFVKPLESAMFGVAVDDEDRVYTQSGLRPGLFVRLDANGNVAETYLQRQHQEDLPISLFTELKNNNRRFYVESSRLSCHMENLGPDRFLVYLFFPSRYYIVEKGQIARQGDLLPAGALSQLARNLADKDGAKIPKLFRHCFVDWDDPRYFYLERAESSQGKIKRVFLYRFDFSGKLLQVLSIAVSGTTETDIRFHGKRHGLLYGLKEVEEEYRIVTCKAQ